MEKFKRAVIKEEFVAITGDFIQAVVLNQFIYWSERVNDFNEYIKQENERAKKVNNEQFNLLNGWIYKKTEDLIDETMLNISGSTMRKYIKCLIEKGYIQERTNPEYKWDKTIQYRVDLVKISNDLKEIGYTLQDYKSLKNDAISKNETRSSKNETRSSKNENRDCENQTAISKITTKITTKITNIEGKESKKESDIKSNSFDSIVNSFTDNKKLKDTIYEFIKMRKLKRIPITDYALKLMLSKLNKLSDDTQIQIEILNQSIVGGWQGIFPLKEDQNKLSSTTTERVKKIEEKYKDFDFDNIGIICK